VLRSRARVVSSDPIDVRSAAFLAAA